MLCTCVTRPLRGNTSKRWAAGSCANSGQATPVLAQAAILSRPKKGMRYRILKSVSSSSMTSGRASTSWRIWLASIENNSSISRALDNGGVGGRTASAAGRFQGSTVPGSAAASRRTAGWRRLGRPGVGRRLGVRRTFGIAWCGRTWRGRGGLFGAACRRRTPGERHQQACRHGERLTPTTDHRSPTTDRRPLTTDHRSPTTSSWLLVASFEELHVQREVDGRGAPGQPVAHQRQTDPEGARAAKQRGPEPDAGRLVRRLARLRARLPAGNLGQDQRREPRVILARYAQRLKKKPVNSTSSSNCGLSPSRSSFATSGNPAGISRQ